MADKVTGDHIDNVPQTAVAAPRMFLLFFGFPVLSFRPWSYSVFSYCCSVLPATSPGGHDTSQFILFHSICFYFSVRFFLPFVFFVNASGLLAFVCRTCRTYVIPLFTLLTTLEDSISVSWLCDLRVSISLGGRDTGCAGCRRVGRTS